MIWLKICDIDDMIINVIEYVLVNGKSKYRAGDMFYYDVEIVIAYHTFKKDDINA